MIDILMNEIVRISTNNLFENNKKRSHMKLFQFINQIALFQLRGYLSIINLKIIDELIIIITIMVNDNHIGFIVFGFWIYWKFEINYSR